MGDVVKFGKRKLTYAEELALEAQEEAQADAISEVCVEKALSACGSDVILALTLSRIRTKTTEIEMERMGFTPADVVEGLEGRARMLRLENGLGPVGSPLTCSWERQPGR